MKRTALVLAGLLVPGLALAGETPVEQEEAAIEQAGEETLATAEDVGEETAATAEEVGEETAATAEDVGEGTVATVEEGAEDTAQAAEETGESAVAEVEQAGEQAGQATEEAAADVEQTGEEAFAGAEEAGEKTGQKVEETAQEAERSASELALGGAAAQEQKVKGTILAIDLAKGTLDLRGDDPQKQRHTFHGTPAQLETYEAGQEVEISYRDFGENKWLAGERGEIDVEGLAAAETVQGTVKSVDKNKGEVVLSEGEPGSFKAHPEVLEQVEPGQFISLTYQKLGEQNWAEKIEQGTQEAAPPAAPQAEPGAAEEPVMPESQEGVESPPSMEQPATGTEMETEEGIFEDEVEVEPTEEDEELLE